MNINRSNYELYILDYYEKTLPKNEEEELLSFLILNPDLKEEFDNFDTISLTPDNDIKFDLKSALKHNDVATNVIINESNYTDYFIASIEGDLDAKQQNQLTVFLENNPVLNQEYFQFTLTKLKPDTSIVFDDKKSLKRYTLTNFNKKAIYTTVSIAATFLIIFSVSVFIKNGQKPDISTLSAFNETSTDSNSSKNFASIIDNPFKAKPVKVKSIHPSINIKNNKVAVKRKEIQTITIEPKDQNPIEIATNLAYVETENRDYYTNVNQLLSIKDENNNSAKKNQKLLNNPFNRISLPNEQITGVQDFLYNVANRSYSRVETFTNNVKSTYKNIEHKLAIK